MQHRALGPTGLAIAPIVFGGNVLGWTADEATSFRVLDAFVDHGFNAIDTADSYSRWVPGHQGGESETVIGRWLKARPGMRERVVIFTKVGSDLGDDRKGLSERWILQAVEGSLTRLGVDEIDLYFSHWPDASVPQAETLGAFGKLIEAGKVKAIGASNQDAAMLREALDLAETGLPAYGVLQPHYNLYTRDQFEGALADLCVERGIGVVSYFALASGFLSGKYRGPEDFSKSARGGGMQKYLTDRGMKLLAALDAVAENRGVTQAEVALAWLIGARGITAPIASATSVAQVESFARAAALELTPEERAALEVD